MVYIYVLHCANNKFYIGKTQDPKFRLENHFESNGATWTKKYKPQNIERIIPDCDDFDEDKWTLKYMGEKGIDNVRGGSFCEIKISHELHNFILRMLYGSTNRCFICGSDEHFVGHCPQNNPESGSVKSNVSTIEMNNKKLIITIEGLADNERITINLHKDMIKNPQNLNSESKDHIYRYI